ncbi:MAG: fused MFS/spermidine synthase [Vicinamibacteria bacterium]
MLLQPRLAAAGFLFLLSGAAALVYQVAWQRILVLHSGVGVYSVASVVAAFMLGLGAGSHWGGVLSARVSRRRALLLFAALEAAIGLFALGSAPLYYDLLYRRLGWLYGVPWRDALLHVAALLPPTALMGMSLPFLTRAMVEDVAHAGRTIGVLYSLNVLGAAAGAWATPWLLVRFFGIDGALVAGACVSLTASLGAFGLWRAGAAAGGEEGLAEVEGMSPPAGTGGHGASETERVWLALYALSGLVSLSLEIVWFRVIDVAVKATAFTFGTVLGIFLGGLAAGTFVGTLRAPRWRNPLRLFLVAQAAIPLLAALAVILLARLPLDWPGLGWFAGYWPGYEGFGLGEEWRALVFARLYLVLPLFLYGAPTFLMGLSFVALQQALQRDVRRSGRTVGLLQAANIAGGVLGSLGVGLVGLEWLGSTGTLRALSLAGLVFVAVGFARSPAGRRWPFAALGAALVACALALPGQRALWGRLNGAAPDAPLGEDASAVVAITSGSRYAHQVMVNGKGNSWLPYGGMHSVMGATPGVIHPAPLEIAVVGLGSGDTAWAASCRRETRSVVVYELARPQPRLLAEQLARRPDPQLERLLHDPRIRIVLQDGRSALERGTARYDVIQTDPPPPWGAFAGNLFSVEFFEACARRLKPGGVMSAWSPTPRVKAAFVEVFPHVRVLNHGLFEYLIGGMDPIPGDVAAWIARADTPAVRDWLGPGVVEQLRQSLRTAAPPIAGDVEWQANTDLFPRDEFRTP